MHVVDIIPAVRYRHVPTGRTASLYGSAPWTSESNKANWVTETVGHTWALDDGTVGLCRVPAKTIEEARAVANGINAERRAQLEAHGRMYPDQARGCEILAAEIPTF